jgi:two-component system chemotaxis sensor kinase CheA
VGESSYTIPLLSIRETIQVSRHQVTTTMDGQEMVSLRDRMIPVIRLHDIYGMGTDDTDVDKGLLVVVEHQDYVAGLLIHDILGEQQAVIKGMSRYMDHVMGIAGCTILGDGEVSLILDVPGLIQKAQLRGMERDMTVH